MIAYIVWCTTGTVLALFLLIEFNDVMFDGRERYHIPKEISGYRTNKKINLIKEYEKTIENLSKKNADLESRNAGLRRQRDLLEHENHSLKVSMKEAIDYTIKGIIHTSKETDAYKLHMLGQLDAMNHRSGQGTSHLNYIRNENKGYYEQS